MNFQEANDSIRKANADVQSGVMEERIGRIRVEALRVRDRYGNIWKYSIELGQWLVKNGKGWNRAIPDGKDPAPLWKKVLRVSARSPVPIDAPPNHLFSYLGWLVKGYFVNLPYTILFQLLAAILVFYVARFAHTVLYLNIIDSGKTMAWQTIVANQTRKLIETNAFNMMVAGITETTWALFGFLVSFLLFKAFNGSLIPFFHNLARFPLWTASCFSGKDRNNLLILAVSISLSAFAGRFFETEFAALLVGILLLISFGAQKGSIPGTILRLVGEDVGRLFRKSVRIETNSPYLIVLGSSIGLILFFLLFQQPLLLYAVMGFILLLG